MKIRIYQIEMSLDEKHVAFMPYAYMQEKYPEGIPAELYRLVYEYESGAVNLERLFYIFNMEHPADYRTRSMSLSDVVEVIDPEKGSKFYLCDTIGFREVSFDTSLAQGGSQNG